MIEKIEKRLKMDNYDLEAVFTPAIVNILFMCLIAVWSCYDSDIITVDGAYWWAYAAESVGLVAVTAIVARFTMQIFRGTSRFFEDINYGADRLHFPTTSMLLVNGNDIGDELKKRVRHELKTIYTTSLFSKAKEQKDEQGARREAKDAVALIRKVVDESNDSTTKRKLTRYGIYRNFLGGAVFCLPISLGFWVLDLIHSGPRAMMILVAVLAYMTILCVDYVLAKRAATDYAEALMTTFDKINNNEA